MAYHLFKKWKENCFENQQVWDKLILALASLVSGPIAPNLLSCTVLGRWLSLAFCIGLMLPVSALVPWGGPTRTQNLVVCAGNTASSLVLKPLSLWLSPTSLSFASSWTSSSLTWTTPGHKDPANPLETGTQKCKEKGLWAAASWVCRKAEDGGTGCRKGAFPAPCSDLGWYQWGLSALGERWRNL